MGALTRARRGLERVLEGAVVFLMVTLTTVVIVAVIYRKAGASLTWYDEVASILLAWLTYYGACLAALKRAHIGFDGIVRAVSPGWRMVCVAIAEVCVVAFFGILAWTGWVVLQVLAGDTLVSLPSVPVRLTQSVIPIGAALFILCELLSFPLYWHRLGSALEDEFAHSSAAGADHGKS